MLTSIQYRKYTGFMHVTYPVIRTVTRKGVNIDEDVADISTRLQESMGQLHVLPLLTEADIPPDGDGNGTTMVKDYSTHFRSINFDEWIKIIVAVSEDGAFNIFVPLPLL